MSTVINVRRGDVFLARARELRGPWRRFAGLMLAPALRAGDGAIFRPASGVHTHFMRFPIDLIYLDGTNRVCAIREAMPPWRIDLRRAAAVIEVNDGAARAADVRVGDQLRIVD